MRDTASGERPTVGGRLLSDWRHYQRNPLAPAHPINCEIRIQSTHWQLGNFGEPYEAGIGERHRNVAIANHQIANRSCLSIQIKGDAQGSSEVIQQAPREYSLSGEQEAGFGQYRSACEQWWGDIRELLDGPLMALFIRAEIGDERPGIDHRSRSQWPNPSIYFGLVA